jgi:hypothetical protein
VIEQLAAATGGLWPYLVVIVVGFLPTEVWRVFGVVAARGLDPEGEVLRWVRAVATALVVAVVAKLILSPSGSLAVIPAWGRIGAVVAGVAVLFLTRRNVVWSLVAGEAALIAAGLLARG